MGGAVGEEDYAAGGEFDGGGLGFVGVAADVVVAVGVAGVFEFLAGEVGDDFEGSVGDGGVVDGGPHGGALEGVVDFEVGVVLVPVGAGAVMGGFEEDLVEVEDDGVADEAGDGVEDFLLEGECAEEIAFVVGGRFGGFVWRWSGFCRRLRC